MSSSFIGSKIAIVTKSQSRYSGTIIGIDAQASSIILGNVKCYGTENRLGNLTNGSSASDSIVPIMQFANSDIEDLKIVDEESTAADKSTKTVNNSSSIPTGSAPVKQTSIHDDPAIVSAVVSSSNKETSSVPNRLIRDLNHLNLFDEPKKVLSKTDESHRRTDSGDLGATWSLLSPSKWTGSNSVSQAQPVSNNKSKFFDNFTLNSTESIQPQRSQRWMPSSLNNHGTQTSNRSNQYDDERDLPTRQPFFSEDQTFSPQQNFSINGSHQHRNFTNNRRPPMRRRPMAGGNRETFYDNGMHYDDEFDFESSNRKFNKITSEEEFKQPADSLQTFKLAIESHQDGSIEYQPVYDKKKSFFDNISLQETTDLPVPMYHRSRNQDTFGNNHHNDRYQRSKYRGNGNGNGYGGQRRTNYHNSSNSNQNGYHYRY